MKKYDYIIVGAGIGGLSCAYWLAKLRNLRVAIVDKGDVEKENLEQFFSDLSTGALDHIYSIYKERGVEDVLEHYSLIQDNFELLESELKIIDRNPYVSLYTNGTINMLEDCDDEVLSRLKHFVSDLKSRKLPLVEVENKDWKIGYKFEHEASFTTTEFRKKILSLISSKVDIYPSFETIRVDRELEYSYVHSLKGLSLLGKKVIFTNSNSLIKNLPELKDRIKEAPAYIYKIQGTQYSAELSNYVNAGRSKYFGKTGDAYYYADHEPINALSQKEFNSYISEESLNQFSKQFFSDGKFEIEKNQSFKISYTQDRSPVTGRSKRNPSLYYLGAFGGQSKLYAFKMARDLVGQTLRDKISS